MKIAIYGAGGFGREIAPIARRLIAQETGKGTPAPGSLVFVDDNTSQHDRQRDIPVLPLSEASDYRFAIAVADAAIRRKLAEKTSGQAISLIAATAIIGPEVAIGEGAVICDFAIVTASATIGRQFHCNIYSYVAHDCVVGDFVTLAPRVCVNGNTVIEDDVYIGTGAVLRNGVKDRPLRIGKGAIIGMGAVVTKDVPAGVTVVGNPARIKGA